MSSSTPFSFATLATQGTRSAFVATAHNVETMSFADTLAVPDASALKESSLLESEAPEERFTRAQMDAEIERATASLREELQALHQQEIDAQTQRQEAALIEIFEEVQRWREAITHQSTELLLRLCETLTLHLVQQALLEQPERYIAAVTPALKELMGFGRPRLYVPDFALGALHERMDELKQLHPDHIEIEVLADEALDVGDFRFEVDGGRIDADVEKRLAHLVETCRQRALSEFAEWEEEQEEDEEVTP